jgi:hypothetical protein
MRLNEGRQIRNTLGAILNSALTDDEFRDVVDFEAVIDHLAQPDRWRIGRVEANRLQQLTTTVQGLRDAWRPKYGSGPIGAFDEDEVFRDIQLVEGRIVNPAVLAENWPVTPSAAHGTAIGTSARTTPAAVGTTGGFFERNRDIAVVRIDGVDRSPAVVSLINERFDRWRVDIPDTIDTDALINNLQQRLEAARAGSATWPLDHNAAHRHLANEIFLALYGVAAAR